MSIEALNAVPGTFPTIKTRLAEIPASERPSFDAVTSVSQHLANKHRPGRGYVNESVEQISEALCMSPRKVRRALAALDVLGIWVSQGKGNQHAPTRRVAAFLNEASSGSRTEQDEPSIVRLPDAPDEEHRPVATSASSGSDRASSAYRTTPPSNPQCVPPVMKGLEVRGPLTIGAVTCAPDLADFARRIIAEELPTQPRTERRERSVTAADKWLRSLTTAGNPRAALDELEQVLRWALHHRWWAQKATSVTGCADNWPEIVAHHAAETRQSGPKLTAAQQQGLDNLKRFTAPLIEQRKELA